MERLPETYRRPPGSNSRSRQVKSLLRKNSLATVCEEARCPNLVHCFSRRIATFMILGSVCTRACGFCAIKTGRPIARLDDFEGEARRVAAAAEELALKHVVVTSVTRDDLKDGGALAFCKAIEALRSLSSKPKVEVLVPDFHGNVDALAMVVRAKPDVLNHNMETVSRLYRTVRPQASYQRSLWLLSTAKEIDSGLITKTGIMLGLGEVEDEVVCLMRDCRDIDVDCFTAGQYLQPSKSHLPVVEYLSESQFLSYENHARDMGFKSYSVGPLVRSSYNAGEMFNS